MAAQPEPVVAGSRPRLALAQGDIVGEIARMPDASVDAVLHDPPRFGIAGELYSLAFYEQLARVLRRKGRLFHYVGTPNALTSGRTRSTVPQSPELGALEGAAN